ncbi:MAG: peptide ABC transporter substrate-binding protein [Thermomicrobiales bacterium]
MVTGPIRDRTLYGRVTACALLALILPFLLAACGGGGATDTPKAAAPTTSAVTTSTATSAAPTIVRAATVGTAGTALAPSTTASSTTAAASVTASGTTVTAASSPPAGVGPDSRGAAPTKRGGGGTLHLLWWQAPTTLNNHLGQGASDEDASRVVLEPLAVTSINSILPDVPMLAKEIPSQANGTVAADGKSVTWKLRNALWSDGSPVTSADVLATWQYITKPENGATDSAQYANIAGIDTPDATTVTITFKEATARWYLPFTNLQGVINQKQQIDSCGDPQTCSINTAPIGSGPFKVTSFTPGDNVQYVINDTYWDAAAPFFDAIDLKGGGDAGAAAQALQAGQVDFAWNLQIAPDALKQVTDAGAVLDTGPGFGIERIAINFTDPNQEVNGEKSSLAAPHPFLTDPKVREALSWLVDRESIAKNLYPVAKPTCNVLLGIPPALQSKNTTCGYDVAKANQLLDDAGWKKGADGIRAKNGVQMRIAFVSSVNPVRQREEQVLKTSFQQAGIAMDFSNVDADVFFGQPTNPDAASRFEKDMEMFTNSPTDPDAQQYLSGWTTKEIPQQSNGWQGANFSRWSNTEYDTLYNQLTTERNPERRAQIETQLNDLVVNNHVAIPIVDRYASNGHARALINTNYDPWDSALWNVAYWQITK